MSPKVASEYLVSADVAPSSASGTRPIVASFHEERRRAGFALAHLTDLRLALLLSAVMFAISAWPLALVEVPPYQDLPNHMAAVTVMDHPSLYPEFVFNGWAKTNTVLFAWLYFGGKVFGLKLAAKLFSLFVLGFMAFTLPRFVLTLTGDRRRMIVSTLFVWPFVHNWFVGMGMLDFALAVPLAMTMLMAMHAQERRPTLKNAAIVMSIGVATWLAHGFCVLVVAMLAVIHVAVQRGHAARISTVKKLAPALLLPAALAVYSVAVQASDPVGPMTGFMKLDKLLPPWELAYNAWAEWFWTFTKLTISTFVPMLGLVWFAIRNRKESPAYFSGVAVVVLLLLYVLVPYTALNWFHVNSRFIPFLWLSAALRVPTHVPRKVAMLLGVSAIAASVGLGVDFKRLDREHAAFTAGMAAVPEGAKLLPLIFRAKQTSENTRNLLHEWGYYVMEKHTTAPLLFAHSHSFPVMYREAPPMRLNHLVLEGFAPSMATPDWLCGAWHSSSVILNDCEKNYVDRWSEFWQDAEPRFDHLLVWGATPEALARIPAEYEVVFHQDDLMIFARKDAKNGASAAR